jgi:hypothetical protein
VTARWRDSNRTEPLTPYARTAETETLRLRYFEGSSVRSEQCWYSMVEAAREVTTLFLEHSWRYFLDIEVARARLR